MNGDSFATCSAPACPDCRRRSWLLGALSPLLDYHRRDTARLAELLALPTDELIDALAGSRRDQLRRDVNRLSVDPPERSPGGGELCGHDHQWPSRLDLRMPGMLWLSSPLTRFKHLLAAPTVAILGGSRASPYGVEMAEGMARGLAASGVSIVAGLADAIARAAHSGALEAAAGSIAVAGDGLGAIRPGDAEQLASRVASRGCVVSALPCGESGRRWGAAAAMLGVSGLADVTLVIEAEAGEPGFSIARSALSLGRPVAGVPGPITSRLSGGPHALIIKGATLIRDAADVLELLYECRPGEPRPMQSPPPRRALDELQESILGRVGAGEDTPEQLSRGSADAGAVLAALGVLEAIGALRRLPDGRYQARGPALRSGRSD